MPTDILQVILKATNEVSGPVKQATQEIEGLGTAGQKTGGLLGGLGGIAKLAGAAGIGLMAVGAARTR